ncbi:hypothetical protein XENOCAPTIV_019336 [Xenoophorus captivus]|uniref:Uncharacterized protein n=1 Tax=Xenoophorus captivus TaxID=1517983 RepID=A0ABV0QSL2_9TELE
MMGVERTSLKPDRETITSRLYGLTAWKIKTNSREEKERKIDLTDHQLHKAHRRKAPFSLKKSTTNCPLKKRRPFLSPADQGPGGQPSNDDTAANHPGKCLLEGGQDLHEGGRRTLSSGRRGRGIHDSQRPEDDRIPYGPTCQWDIEDMSYGTWQGIIWVKGPYNVITVTHLKELNRPRKERCSQPQRLSQLKSRLVKIGPTHSGTGAQEWYKTVNVPEVTEQNLKESDFSPAGKEKLRKTIASANVAQFKNDYGDLGPKYVHLIEGGVHPPVRQ